MPICNKCGRMAASAELRRSTKSDEWMCKDKVPCKTRAKELSEQADWEKPGPARPLSGEKMREDIRYRNGW